MAVEADPLPLFGISVTGGGRGPVICVAGEVDLASAPYLGDAIVAAATVGDGSVIVDLADVTFMDSTGLGVLVSGHKRLESQGRQLRLRSPSERVVRVLELSGLNRMIHIEVGPPNSNGTGAINY